MRKLALVLLILTNAAWAIDPCGLALRTQHTDLKSPRLPAAISSQLLQRSQTLSAQLAAQTQPQAYDLVIVGSGADAAALKQSFLQSKPGARILTLEKSEAPPSDPALLAQHHQDATDLLLNSTISTLQASGTTRPRYTLALSGGGSVITPQLVYATSESAPAHSEWIPVFPEHGPTALLAQRALRADGTVEDIYVALSDTELAARLGSQLAQPLSTRVFNLAPQAAQIMVDAMLKDLKPSTRPEVILMAGIPGSGKTTVVKKYIAQHFSADEQPLIVDPDGLRPILPGYVELARQNPRLASLVSHRAAAIQFQMPLIRTIYTRRASIVVDGSLRDFKNTVQGIGILRKQYPEYKVTLIRVKLPVEVAYDRIQKRFEKTGRRVPLDGLEDLRQWDAQIDLSMKVLKPLVDSYIEVDN